MKKFVKYLLVFCLMVPFAFMFAGCGESEPASVMNLSVNPEISFVLDGNNNVLSVNFGNTDAGTIYADIDFVGKDVDSTIQLFIERAVISGHFTLNGDTVSVEINGNSQAKIDELKQQAKTKIEDIAKTLGTNVTVELDKLTETAQRQALIQKAKLLAPEKTNTEIEEMSNSELVKLINDKQKEYKDLAYSQIQTITDQLNTLYSTAITEAKTALDNALAELKQLKTQLEQKYDPVLSATITMKEQAITAFQKTFDDAVKLFQNAKEEAIAAAKKQYETIKQTAYDTFKNEVKTAKTNVVKHLQAQKDAGKITEDQYNAWVNLINSYAPTANN